MKISAKDWERIRSRIKVLSDSCWIWTRGTNGSGYGTVSISNKSHAVHRIYFERFKGHIKKGLVVEHLCRNRLCCNPDHLEAVTLEENILRGEGCYAKNKRKTHCKHGHEFTKANTYIDKLSNGKSRRVCKACKNAIARTHYHRTTPGSIARSSGTGQVGLLDFVGGKSKKNR